MNTSAEGMRVVHVVCTDEFAGVERYIVTLSRGLADRGCEVMVLGGSPSRMPAELDGSPVLWRPARRIPAAIRGLARWRRPHIVHVHMTAAELAASLARPVSRAPIISTRHFAQHRGSTPPARLVGRWLTGTVAGQLAISDFVAATTEGDSTVVRLGVPSRRQAPSAGRERVVLVAQRLEREKRTDLALEVWARSGLASRGWQLLIAGDGTQRAELMRQASALSISDSCQFLGLRSDMQALYDSASILIAPRPDEPFGLSVVEAMASGLPVLAAAGGGHAETVGRAEDPALFDPHTPSQGAHLLAALADDPARRLRYGAELRTVQQREFTIDRQIDQTLAFYRSVLLR